ncbi:hypothetical protein K438DRAFT_2028032 [Mycena galopus ATCC 62051]|nr:hypothetical protein K438DRAFT_2028032 [Mycena galopus ATCC 62051]
MARTAAQAQVILHELGLNAPIIEVFLNGLYTCLLLLTICVIWTNKTTGIHRKWLWPAIVILLYLCASIHSGITWEGLVSPVENFGASPDIITALTHPKLALKVLGLVASALSFTFADMIMIWRCWIVWGRSWPVIVVPILGAIAGTVCAGLGITGQISASLITNPTQSQGLAPLVRFSTPFLGMSLAVTLYTTGLIAWRILRVQRYAAKNGIERSGGAGSDLSAVLEIMVESSALYAASLFVFIVLLAMKSEKQVYIQNIHSQIAGIAPTLLMLRISAGHARNDTQWSIQQSSLQFAGTVDISIANSELGNTAGSGSGSAFMLDQFSRGPSSHSSKTAGNGKVLGGNVDAEKFPEAMNVAVT